MAKKPTRKQKVVICNYGLNPKDWLVVKNPPGKIYIRHRKKEFIKVLNEPENVSIFS